MWENYTQEIDEAAWRCAQGAAHAIREGVFWPPNENIRPDFDDFASLFQHGVAASVVWNNAAARDENIGAPAKTEGSAT
jgi:ATP-dependent helicase/nuclease subunit B